MADEPERMDDELRLLREQRHQARCTRMYSRLLEDFHQRSGLPKEQARRSLVTVLCALEQPLRPLSAEDARAWLPTKLHEALQACPPRREANGVASCLETFLQHVEEDLGSDRAEAERTTRAVFTSLRACISEGEAQQVGDALPLDMRSFWVPAC